MVYDLPTWVNSTTPGLSQTNLGKYTTATADLDTRVTVLEAGIATNVRTASYTLVLGDAGKAVEFNSANAVTLTIPPNSSVAFPIGSVMELFALGTGQVTIAPGSGVTLRSSNGLKLRAQYSVAAIRKRSTDEWVCAGDLSV